MVSELIKALGTASSGAAVVTILVVIVVYLKSKENKSCIDKLEGRTDGQDKVLIKHGQQLVRIEEGIKYIADSQKSNSRKLNKLLKINGNGGS